MSLRINLDETVAKATAAPIADGELPTPSARQLLDASWEAATSDTLMLYVAEEPRVGLEFSYHGLRWQIVDYRDGWVARLLVD